MQQMPEEKAEYAKDHDDQEQNANPPDNQVEIDHGEVQRHFIPFNYAVW
jgi:hypothetical protein